MRRLAAIPLALVALAGATFVTVSGTKAGNAFGTREEARAMADDLKAFVEENGIDQAAEMLRRDDNRFGSSEMGVSLIEVRGDRLIVLGHSRFPTIEEVDFTDQQDLRGNYLMRDFHEAAQNGGGFVENWYPHYDTEEEYHYHCLAEWAVPESAILTVCI